MVLNLETTIQSLLAGAGLAGLAISFALQGTLANTLSGLLIATNNDINIGDWGGDQRTIWRGSSH
jgi:small conductance mechanosensitive channel